MDSETWRCTGGEDAPGLYPVSCLFPHTLTESRFGARVLVSSIMSTLVISDNVHLSATARGVARSAFLTRQHSATCALKH